LATKQELFLSPRAFLQKNTNASMLFWDIWVWFWAKTPSSAGACQEKISYATGLRLGQWAEQNGPRWAEALLSIWPKCARNASGECSFAIVLAKITCLKNDHDCPKTR
jgi:hypothetical protein